TDYHGSIKHTKKQVRKVKTFPTCFALSFFQKKKDCALLDTSLHKIHKLCSKIRIAIVLSLRKYTTLRWCKVSTLHSLILLSQWLIGAGGQSTPGTVASLSSHRKDLREKHVSEDSEGSGFCFRRRLRPCPKDA